MTRRELFGALAMLAAGVRLGHAGQQSDAEANLHTVTLLIDGMT